MEGFLHILKLNPEYESIVDVKEILHNFKTKSLNVTEVTKNNITSVYFSNEHVEYPYKDTSNGLFTPVGVFTRNRESIKDYLSSNTPANKQNFIKNLEGQFAIGYSNFNKQEIDLYTHVARIETLFSFISDEIIIVGTDPLIISLVANHGHVKFSHSSMYSFIINGYYGDNLTPFADVTALPGNSHINISKTGISTYNLDNLYTNLLNIEYNKKDYDNLTDLFLNSFNTQDNDKEFKLALTGGKDSRLIFAAMNNNNFDLSLYTTGFEDNPDVVIAKKIAELYNLNHKTTSPKISEENTITINLYSKIKRVMMSTSGMVYGYENVGNLGNYSGHKSFDGIGAELIKGGFSAFINSNDNSDKHKLVTTFNRNNQILQPSNDNLFGTFLNEFIDSDLGLHKLQILYSLQYRTGRLTSAAKNASNYTKQSHSPFLDNKFLREALRIKYDDNKNEEIHYQIMKRIDERLIDIPFAKDRWRVEKFKPLRSNDYYNWLNRQPFYPSTVLGNYNWRQVQNNDKVIVDQFKSIILSNPKHMIYDIVDYDSISKLFNNKLKSSHMRLIWSLASVIIFVNELSNVSNNIFNKNIKLTLPSTSISEFKNKKSIIDLTSDFLPLNKSISYDAKNRIVTIENFEKHRKLKLLPGIFSESPSEIYFKNISKLSVKIYLSHSKRQHEITGQILYFKSNELIKSQYLDANKKNGYTEFYHDNDKVKQYDSFRILLNFNKLEVSNKLKLDYAFYELTY